MSGIFRYNSSTATPDKRWTISPFCVSPGQLQDVTTESPFFFGCRSPFFTAQSNGSISPSQGRSVREFEEQMAALRKENFNLKLRIYFLEEKIPGLNGINTPEGQETLMKQYIDNKVDTEILRTDLEEKQQILKEAGEALTHMENIQRETELKNQQIIDELNQRIQTLELENQSIDKCTDSDVMIMNDLIGRTNLESDNIDMMQKIRELEGLINCTEKKNKELTTKLKLYDATILNKDKLIEKLEANRKDLNFQNLELKEILDLKQQFNIQKFHEELAKSKSDLADKICEIDDLQKKLIDKNQSYDIVMINMKKLVQISKLMKNKIEELKKMLKFKTIIVNKEFPAFTKKSLSDSECFCLRDSLDESCIKNSNLRNSEVKNEKIHNTDLVVFDEDLKLIESGSSESDKNLSNEISESLIVKLTSGKKRPKADADEANKWRKESGDICVILQDRLEELADFLDSLLKRKEILNAITFDRHAIQRGIEKTLNLSRNFTDVGISLNEKSTSKINNFQKCIDNSEELQNYNLLENNLSQSATSFKKEFINDPKFDIIEIKDELKKNKQLIKETFKKDRRSLVSSYHVDQSESETWSEPDRNVSYARMGLEETSCILSNTKNTINRNEQISEVSLNYAGSSSSENSDLIRKSKSNMKDKISQYEQIILLKDNKILEIQCELLEADNRLKKETLKLVEATQKLNEYKINNEIMEVELSSLKNQSKNLNVLKANEEVLRLDLQNKTVQLNKLLEERNKFIIDIRVAEAQVENLKKEIDNLKQKNDENIQSLQNNEKQRLAEMHNRLHDLLEKNVKELELKHQESIEREWVSINEYNNVIKQTEKLKSKIIEAENTIQYLNENEIELKNHLIENEKSVRAMRKTLDETTLSTSKVILERTKAITEKLTFEAKMQELANHLELVVKEKNIIEKELQTIKNSGYLPKELNIMNLCELQENQRLDSSSPDLGIDSDTGKYSNMEANQASPDNDKTIIFIEDNSRKNSNTISLSQILSLPNGHDCSQVYKENLDLRGKLKSTVHQYQETLKRLRTANQLKEQVERDIRQQLHKTNLVLKNIRTNIVTNLENTPTKMNS